MKSCLTAGVLAFVALLSLGMSAQAAEWGTLTGQFIYDGKAPAAQKLVPNKDVEVCGKQNLFDETLIVGNDGQLANVVVYLRTAKADVHPDYEKSAQDTVVLDNKNCRFDPHIAVLRTTQTLEIKNSDPVGHNSKLDPLKNPPINPIIAAGNSVKQNFKQEEALPIKVGCNIHPWMGGWVLVRNNPYATVSDKDGNFTIENLPAGTELEFQLWQEKSGYLKNAQAKGVKVDNRGRFKIKIKPGNNDLGQIKVDPKLFEGK